MDHILDSIQASVVNRNWHAALALALTIPDICGQIEYPHWAGSGNTGKRYPAWFDIWVKEKLFRFGHQGKEFPMSGSDCYALRNAFLHTGVKEARPDGKPGYKLIVPTSGNLANMSTSGAGNDESIVLYVGTESFSNAICDGAREWKTSVLTRCPEAKSEIDNLLSIQEGEVSVTYTAVVGDFVVTNTNTFW
jgi:hypothetical protein